MGTLCDILGTHQPIKWGTRPYPATPGEVNLACTGCHRKFAPAPQDAFTICPHCGAKVKPRTERYTYCGTCGVHGPFRQIKI